MHWKRHPNPYANLQALLDTTRELDPREMAELQLELGYIERALAIYEQLLLENPRNDYVRHRCEWLARLATANARTVRAVGRPQGLRSAGLRPAGARWAARPVGPRPLAPRLATPRQPTPRHPAPSQPAPSQPARDRATTRQGNPSGAARGEVEVIEPLRTIPVF